MSPIIEVSTYSDYTKAVDELKKKDGSFFLYFLSDKVDGKMWCPDCVNVDPFVRPLLEKNPNTPTILIWCAKTEYRTPDYPFKADVLSGLKALPQLNKVTVKDGSATLQGKLIENDITQESAPAFIQA